MQRLMCVVAIVSSAFSVIGCGSSDDRNAETPPVSMAEQKMVEVVEDHSMGFMRLDEFEKVNGQKSVVDGVEKYTMHYRGTVSFADDCFWSFERTVRATPVGIVYSIRKTRTFGGIPSPDSQRISSLVPALAGDEIGVEGSIDFEKFEEGWQVAESRGLQISSVGNDAVTNNAESVFNEKPSAEEADQYADEVRARASELQPVLFTHVPARAERGCGAGWAWDWGR